MDPVEKILARKALAFLLVAAGVLGTVCGEQAGLSAGALLDVVLIACSCVGVILWADPKRLERIHRREQEERNGEEDKKAP
jgi:hypothetical protein